MKNQNQSLLQAENPSLGFPRKIMNTASVTCFTESPGPA